MDKTLQILRVLKRFDAKGDNNPNWGYINSVVRASVFNNQPISLVNFTCSTINPKFMFDPTNPQLYISLNPTGNNLEADLPQLSRLYTTLNKIYPTQIIILIGNTDPFYIYTEEGKKLPNLKTLEFWKKFSRRWKKYKLNLQRYLQINFPQLDCQIVSWYELETKWSNFGWNFLKQFRLTMKQINSYFDEKDFKWEFNNLNDAFGEGKYFYDLEKPKTSTLKIWVKRKLTEYAVQGLWIKQIFPEAILLQNEKPSDLRTKMYQPLVKKYLNSQLPVLYPYGIDNSGYQ